MEFLNKIIIIGSWIKKRPKGESQLGFRRGSGDPGRTSNDPADQDNKIKKVSLGTKPQPPEHFFFFFFCQRRQKPNTMAKPISLSNDEPSPAVTVQTNSYPKDFETATLSQFRNGQTLTISKPTAKTSTAADPSSTGSSSHGFETRFQNELQSNSHAINKKYGNKKSTATRAYVLSRISNGVHKI